MKTNLRHAPVVEVLELVRCEVCGQTHDAKGEAFISVHGNIHIGLTGGIIGNNFAPDGRLARISIICRTPSCVGRALADARISLISTREELRPTGEYVTTHAVRWPDPEGPEPQDDRTS
jgi:hypothetical protein